MPLHACARQQCGTGLAVSAAAVARVAVAAAGCGAVASGCHWTPLAAVRWGVQCACRCVPAANYEPVWRAGKCDADYLMMATAWRPAGIAGMPPAKRTAEKADKFRRGAKGRHQRGTKNVKVSQPSAGWYWWPRVMLNYREWGTGHSTAFVRALLSAAAWLLTSLIDRVE